MDAGDHALSVAPSGGEQASNTLLASDGGMIPNDGFGVQRRVKPGDDVRIELDTPRADRHPTQRCRNLFRYAHLPEGHEASRNYDKGEDGDIGIAKAIRLQGTWLSGEDLPA